MDSALYNILDKVLEDKVGPWPSCEGCRDWAQFSNVIGQLVDNGLKRRHSKQDLRKQFKNHGGIGLMWRNKYPSSAAYLAQYYGAPALNYRWGQYPTMS